MFLKVIWGLAALGAFLTAGLEWLGFMHLDERVVSGMTYFAAALIFIHFALDNHPKDK